MKIWVVRHGETAAKNRFAGWSNPPLLPKGRKTAKKVALLLEKKAKNAGTIYSSPLARAKQTAKIIAKELGGKKIFIEEKLKERNFGLWEGKTRKEVEQIFPKSISRWLADPYKETPAKGESFFDLEKRLVPFAKKIKKQKQEKIIIVTHAGVIKVLPILLLGKSKKQSLKTSVAYNAIRLFDLEKKKMRTFKAE